MREQRDRDPLVGVEAEAYLYHNTYTKRNLIESHNRKPINRPGGQRPRIEEPPVRLLPEPAVRKAMVAWLKVQACGHDYKDEDGGYAIRVVAERLAGGGDEK